MFARVGYLDELCTFGGEEFDYSLRCAGAGFQTLYIPEVLIKHNSFFRPGPVGADRREKWVYNYVRVLYKHFPKRIAYLFSFRYLYSAIRSGHAVYGPAFVIRLLKAAAMGRRDGRIVSVTLPAETIAFYMNPDLRPEYGNVPIHFMCRLIGKLSRLIKHMIPEKSNHGYS
jgi:hypothetical protein